MLAIIYVLFQTDPQDAFSQTINSPISITATPAPTPSTPYCLATVSNPSSLWISQVKTGEIDNISAGDGYRDYSEKIRNARLGENVDLEVKYQLGSKYLPSIADGAVFVDFNNNHIFETNEQVATWSQRTFDSQNRVLPPVPITRRFAVPYNSAIGDLRMRVRLGLPSALTKAPMCGRSASNSGEIEDYTLRVQNSLYYGYSSNSPLTKGSLNMGITRGRGPDFLDKVNGLDQEPTTILSKAEASKLFSSSIFLDSVAFDRKHRVYYYSVRDEKLGDTSIAFSDENGQHLQILMPGVKDTSWTSGSSTYSSIVFDERNGRLIWVNGKKRSIETVDPLNLNSRRELLPPSVQPKVDPYGTSYPVPGDVEFVRRIAISDDGRKLAVQVTTPIRPNTWPTQEEIRVYDLISAIPSFTGSLPFPTRSYLDETPTSLAFYTSNLEQSENTLVWSQCSRVFEVIKPLTCSMVKASAGDIRSKTVIGIERFSDSTHFIDRIKTDSASRQLFYFVIDSAINSAPTRTLHGGGQIKRLSLDATLQPAESETLANIYSQGPVDWFYYVGVNIYADPIPVRPLLYNPMNPYDVNADGIVNVSDFYAVDNFIKVYGSVVSELVDPKLKYYFDVDGNHIVNQNDVLLLRNYLSWLNL